MQNKKLPKVSFIIPTLNAAWILKKCLISIRSQSYPSKKIEIIISDAGSTDKTVSIAKKYQCKIITNPFINQEPGKNLGLKNATGDICFFLDADNVLANKNWIQKMVKPYQENHNVKGLLPQTIPPKDSNSFNRYLGYLFTDPFTWFVYGNAANPKDYGKIYNPIVKTSDYTIYKFTVMNHPLFGLAQGVGTTRNFKKTGVGLYDDILAGIKLIKEGGLIAYVPHAGVYHYHVDGFKNFLQKYQWRIRNNFQQRYKGFGLVNREKYMSTKRKRRRMLFLLYSFSLLFPLIDALKLSIIYRDFVMLWHLPASMGLGILILLEYVRHVLKLPSTISTVYGK